MTDARSLRPKLDSDSRRALFLEGIESFNEARFFEAHEVWEEIWRSDQPEPREFFQGLIQIAVGFHHFFHRQRTAPAARVLARGRQRLQAYLPTRYGLALGCLIENVVAWERWLAAPGDGEPPRPRIQIGNRDEVR